MKRMIECGIIKLLCIDESRAAQFRVDTNVSISICFQTLNLYKEAFPCSRSMQKVFRW